jgi:hypothetical protein
VESDGRRMALVSAFTKATKLANLREPHRRHECRRGTHECARHERIQAEFMEDLLLPAAQRVVVQDAGQTFSLARLWLMPRRVYGDTSEDDHAIGMEVRNGEASMYVRDYGKMREGGMLLSESIRINAEGDYDEIKAVTDKHRVLIYSRLHDQVVEHLTKLGLPATCFAGISRGRGSGN